MATPKRVQGSVHQGTHDSYREMVIVRIRWSVSCSITTNHLQAAERPHSCSYMSQYIMSLIWFSRAKKTRDTYDFKAVQSDWAPNLHRLNAKRPKIWETCQCSEKPLSNFVTVVFRTLWLWCGYWSCPRYVTSLGLHLEGGGRCWSPQAYPFQKFQASEEDFAFFYNGSVLCPPLLLALDPLLSLFSPVQHLVEILERFPWQRLQQFFTFGWQRLSVNYL